MGPFHNRSIRTIAVVGLVALGAASLGALRSRLAAQPAADQAPAAAPAGDAARGKAVYDKSCVECHGDSGKGDGPASTFLTPRPRDFTAGKYKIRSTETGSVPTDDDLMRSVRQGLPGSAMPGWEGILSDAQIHDVVEHVKALSPRFRTDPPSVVKLGAPIPSSPESVVRGQKVFEKLRCSSCHGTDGRGAGAIATDFKDDWNQPLNATDLTEPWTFHGGATSLDVYLRFRTGMTGTPMPSFAGAATEAEVRDLANFVVSLARKPVWSMDAAELAGFYARQTAEAKANPVKRGAYLVATLGCALCHTPVDEQNRALPGMRLAGGMRIRIEPFGDYPTGNLTSDRETGLGTWTDGEIKQVLTKGTLRDGTRLLPYPMDWASYSTLAPEDISAIVAYLRTVPPVSNKVPALSRTSLPLYLWGKFRMLILGDDLPMAFFPGKGGGLKLQTPHGTFVSRNLTPDKDTGLGRRTDEQVKRVLRSGVFQDGHVVPATIMPWGAFSNWTEEDRHAVVVYLRNLKPVRHETPEPAPGNGVTIPGAIEQDYGGKDYGTIIK